jgi:CheY-like chemotaxis protein
MHTDLTKVRQVLFNLLSNASKFTKKGAITIEAARRSSNGGDQVEFRIADTGIGMTPEQVGKLFQPFTQIDATAAKKFGGTGLGLSISKRFCEMMGGNIEAASEWGKGSVFTVRLPARVGPPKDEHPPRTEAASAATRQPAVLVIDDDPAVRDLMTRILTVEGVRPVTAPDGPEGLRLAAEVRPAVIFLDVLMPRMDGWAVLNALKRDSVLAGIPVVLLTIINDSEMGYLLGASEYLNKPIDRERLAAILQKFHVRGVAGQVLVVEDDKGTRDVIRRTLSKHGWRVHEAENGQVALDRVAQQLPELILLDLMMPEMDGFEFLAELRRNQAWRSIPVVVLTSKDLTNEERRRLNGQVEKILQKGMFNREALLAEVKRVVAQHTGRRRKSDVMPDDKEPPVDNSNAGAPAMKRR